MVRYRYSSIALGFLAFTQAAQAQTLPAPNQWDGVTQQAKLDRPYEDAVQTYVPFGLTSYFSHPWRSYMDTWPADHFLGSMGYVTNVRPKYEEAVCKIMSEAGIRTVRTEMGWGNFDWEDKLSGNKRQQAIAQLKLFKKYGIRPLVLLNSHHIAPCPTRQHQVKLEAETVKGETTFKISPQDVAKIRPGYTGPINKAEYCAAKPLITSVDPDGTCHLSAPLSEVYPKGPLTLVELKYQPWQGVKVAGASDEENAKRAAAAAATLEGWNKYVAETCSVAKEALGTDGLPDAGFDLEVWNEQTFGSSFLDINYYYQPRIKFSEPFRYIKQRPVQPNFRPDAKTEFKLEGNGAMLGATVDYITARPKEFPNVKVDDGLGNQWPWNGSGDAWDGQGAYSRHYYLGDWKDVEPGKVSRPDIDTINALGKRDGIRATPQKDWYDIVLGSNFIPKFRLGLPELGFTGFKTESLVRDVMPDAVNHGWGREHGRFAHNGDFKPMELWQTEFNYGRGAFFNRLFKETGAERTDPRAIALDAHLVGKFLVRMYFSQNHKGLKRLYVFAPGDGPYGINMLTPAVFSALDKSNGEVTPEVRAALPSGYTGLGWVTKQMETGEKIDNPRSLRVDELIEYKPRLQFAGDGTPEHPHQWNRDWFTFMPYQLSPNKFFIPYYVMSVDANAIYDEKKDPFDPARYDMPDQDFDVTIGNCAGMGAKVSAYDPVSNTSVPVSIVKATANTLTVRVKTTDYPRILQVTEEKPGPQILAPTVAADAKGNLTVRFKTNLPTGAVRMTYGKDWKNRSAMEVSVPGGKSAYEVKVPTGLRGVIAVRVKVASNGLSTVWPKYDEDVAGQVVVPGSTLADVKPPEKPKAPPTTVLASTAVAEPYAAPANVTLAAPTVREKVFYSLALPQGTTVTGSDADWEAVLGTGPKAVRVRGRYFPGGTESANDSLPFVAVGDDRTEKLVQLPGGDQATVYQYLLSEALHPGMTNLSQTFVMLPIGKPGKGAVLISFGGSPDGIKAEETRIKAVIASLKAVLPAK